jgi:phosphotransferase system enzyme I (PtsI)
LEKFAIKKSIINNEVILEGIPASPGIITGPCFKYREISLAPEPRIVPESKVDFEIKRFKKGVKKTLQLLKKSMPDSSGMYSEQLIEILSLQQAFLEDEIFLEEIEDKIKNERYDALYATYAIFQKKREHFLQQTNEYFRDRAFDIQSLKRMLIKNILGKKTEIRLRKPSIVIADMLSPSDTVRLHQQSVLGFATSTGGKNSHTAIIARALGVPAVVGLERITELVHHGKNIILDGSHGRVIINPRKETIVKYQNQQKIHLNFENVLLKESSTVTTTKDGRRFLIQANIEFEKELVNVKNVGADGIGLFRTEGIFINRETLPTEDEQYEVYSKIAAEIYPQKCVIRTLDIGGDKIMPNLINIQEQNPYLGWRAIRFCLDHRDCFLSQIKAILRANSKGNIQILLPLISSLEEVFQVRELINEAKEILIDEDRPFGDEIKLGIMVELPSVVFLADVFAREVDFFSIGTNDLVQYNLAVDRGNEKVAYLYSHFHPSVIRMIKHTLDAGKSAHIPVSMCGEMAGDPLAIPLLMAMGFECISASPAIIPEIKKIVREVDMGECLKLYYRVTELKTTREVTSQLQNFFKEKFQDLEIL